MERDIYCTSSFGCVYSIAASCFKEAPGDEGEMTSVSYGELYDFYCSFSPCGKACKKPSAFFRAFKESLNHLGVDYALVKPSTPNTEKRFSGITFHEKTRLAISAYRKISFWGINGSPFLDPRDFCVSPEEGKRLKIIIEKERFRIRIAYCKIDLPISLEHLHFEDMISHLKMY